MENVLKKKEAYFEARERMDEAACRVCFALEVYLKPENLRTRGWLAVNENLRKFQAAHAAKDVAYKEWNVAADAAQKESSS